MTLVARLGVRTGQVIRFFVKTLEADIEGQQEEEEIEQGGDSDAEEAV